jgi:prolipoprotein diacylglyceryltransferase
MWTIHPSQLYSLANAAALFGVLHLGFRWKRRHGQIFFFFILLYAVSRFLLEYTRADEAETYLLGLPTLLTWLGHSAAAGKLGGLTISQNVAAAMAAAAVAALAWLKRSTNPHMRAEYEPPSDEPSPREGSLKRKGKRG